MRHVTYARDTARNGTSDCADVQQDGVHCGAVWCIVVQCGALWCIGSVIRCMFGSVLQCVAVCCSVLQFVAVWFN